MDIHEQYAKEAYRRAERVMCAEYLSLADMCRWCGYGETEMREFTRRRDFPKPRAPKSKG